MALAVTLPALAITTLAIAVQQVILYFEICALRRDMRVLLKVTAALNYVVNPWAADNEPTEPNRPPRTRRRWFGLLQ